MSKKTFLVMAVGLWEGAAVAIARTVTRRLAAARCSAGLHWVNTLRCICNDRFRTTWQGRCLVLVVCDTEAARSVVVVLLLQTAAMLLVHGGFQHAHALSFNAKNCEPPLLTVLQ